MTTTRSRVTRRTESAYSVLYSRPRPIVVSILPGDVLEFREAGKRQRFRLSVQTAFRYAVQLSALRIGKRIKELRKAGVPRGEARKRAERETLS